MANTTYVFERMSQTDAANFDATDTLVFIDSATSDLNVTLTPATGLTRENITITSGSTTLTFPANALAAASSTGNLTSTVDNSNLVVGTGGDNTLTYSDPNSATFYGFGGADRLTVTGDADVVIHGGAGTDSLVGGNGDDFIFGGLGTAVAGAADTILGGAGNDHLYGGDFTENVTSTDGADVINGQDGNDYIQGNAGNDNLLGGDGEDRIYGGAGNDTIDGGVGFDTVNGNMGDDLINGGDGNDSLRGGMGNDTLLGDSGQDIILGDLGDDSIRGGVGIDLVTGGAGADVFFFNSSESALGSTVPITDASGAAGFLTGFYDTITDFENGVDKIDLGTVTSGAGAVSAVVLLQAAGATFSTASAAQVYAQQLLDNRTDTATTHEVAAIQVGADTYLFSVESGGATIDSAIKLQNFTASNVDTTDFI